MATLETALEIAIAAHKGQKDKAGTPYILHPLRIMFNVAGDYARIVALLHDVVEDSETKIEDLREAGFSEEILDAVDAITHRQKESYEQYFRRLRNNRLAREVKLADLRDNMDILRLAAVDESAVRRLKRYHHYYHDLQAFNH